MAEEQQISPESQSPDERQMLDIERRFEAKKKELARRGEYPPEKDVLREAIREYAATPEGALEKERETGEVAPSPVRTPRVSEQSDEARDAATEQVVTSLIEVAMTKSVHEAIRRAEAESPNVFDALHDRLADEYYDKLVQLGKIKEF